MYTDDCDIEDATLLAALYCARKYQVRLFVLQLLGILEGCNKYMHTQRIET